MKAFREWSLVYNWSPVYRVVALAEPLGGRHHFPPAAWAKSNGARLDIALFPIVRVAPSLTRPAAAAITMKSEHLGLGLNLCHAATPALSILLDRQGREGKRQRGQSRREHPAPLR